MQPVAAGGLRAEVQQILDETQHHLADAGALVEHALAVLRLDVMSAAGKLHDDVLRRHPAAEQRRHADQPLRPDHADFAAGAVFHCRQHRRQAFLDEIDMLERRSDLIEDLFLRQGDRFQMKIDGKLRQILRRKTGEQTVPDGLVIR